MVIKKEKIISEEDHHSSNREAFVKW